MKLARRGRLPLWRSTRTLSLRARLVLWNIATLALLLLVFGVVVHFGVQSLMMVSIDRELEHRTHRFAGMQGPPGFMFGPLSMGPFGWHGGRDERRPMASPDGAKGPDGQPPSPQAPAGSPTPSVSGQPPVFPGDSGPRTPGADASGPQAEPQGAGRDMRPQSSDPGQGDKQRPDFGFRGGPGGGGPMPGMGRPPGEGEERSMLRFFDTDGNPIGWQTWTPWDRSAIEAAKRHDPVYSVATVSDEPYRVLTRLGKRPDGSTTVLQAAYPLAEARRAVSKMDGALLMLAPIALLLAGWGGLKLTDRVLKPVARLTTSVRGMSGSDLSSRLPVESGDEFGVLSDTFNGLLSRLEVSFCEQQRLVEQLRQSVEQQRRFTADASHELKTPITVIKANTSLCLGGGATVEDYQQSMEDIDRATAAMSKLVQDLLLLARADAGHLAEEPTDIPVIELLGRARGSSTADRRAAITLEVEDPSLAVRGNQDELIRLFVNLLDNAARYTPPDGRIVLGCRRDGPLAIFRVTDTGCGIAAEHLPHLGERFYRVDAARSRPEGGTGLGLSICRSIVEAHGGRLWFESEPGKGTTAWVSLPLGDEGPDDSIPSADAC